MVSASNNDCKKFEEKFSKARLVNGIYSFTQEENAGYCPNCGADVLDSFNEKYCGNCATRIKWS